MIDLAVCLMAGGMLLGAVPLILVFVGDSRDSRRYRRARELRLRERHVRTLEQELGLEPYPLGPLDAPNVPTASPVVPAEVANTWNQHAAVAEVYRAQLLREIRRDD